MLVSDVGMVTLVNEKRPSKANSPILVADIGIVPPVSLGGVFGAPRMN